LSSTTLDGLSSDALLFGRRRPTYVAFDLLMADGIDLRPLPLRARKAAAVARLGEGAGGWIRSPK
jgi:ATP-dependent DNA ligase